MSRKHIALISVLVALAALAGLGAALKTTGLAADGRGKATDALVQARTAQLDRAEQALRAQVAELAAPAAPAPTTASTPTIPTTPAAAGEKVVYVRPAPIVRTVHRNGESGEHESYEHEEREDD